MTVTPLAESAAGIPPDEAGGLLTIDLDAMAANWRLLRDRAGGAEAAAVVKADAYGAGIGRAVPALSRAGCRTFFVAHLSEGIRARAASPDAAIYVLNGFPAGAGAVHARHDLRPVLGSQEEIGEWAAFCRGAGARPAALHVDTGMNRLGLSLPEGLALAGDPRLSEFTPALLMSHFVGAEEPGNPVTARQIEAFAALRAALPALPASLANSSGILRTRAHYDMVRPGYALYGGNPLPGSANPMRPVIRLDARILQVREIGAGESAGYNAAWTAPAPRRLATVAVGYADGYPRSAGGTDAKARAGLACAEALFGGVRCPFVGSVSMDLVILDVTGAPPGSVRRGASVTLIGDDLTLDEVGRRSGTIGYEILTRLGARYARRYVGG